MFQSVIQRVKAFLKKAAIGGVIMIPFTFSPAEGLIVIGGLIVIIALAMGFVCWLIKTAFCNDDGFKKLKELISEFKKGKGTK